MKMASTFADAFLFHVGHELRASPPLTQLRRSEWRRRPHPAINPDEPIIVGHAGSYGRLLKPAMSSPSVPLPSQAGW